MNGKIQRLTALWLISLFVAACADEHDIVQPRIPSVIYPTIVHPADNQPTPDRITLGRLLFNDRRFSRDGAVSCASCHQEHLAFADASPVSVGSHGRPGRSNSPSIMYAGFEPMLLRGSTVPTLEMQVLVPIQEAVEFDMNIVELARLLSTDTTYSSLSNRAYNRPLDPWVLTRAISAYERSLPQFSSRFDLYMRGTVANVLSEQEVRGLNLFTKHCASCHEGLLFTNHDKIAITDSLSKHDPSLMPNTTTLKVPTLRNIQRTPPYLHDGSIISVEAVVRAYQAGTLAQQQLDVRGQSIQISDTEVTEIVNFLETLSDR